MSRLHSSRQLLLRRLLEEAREATGRTQADVAQDMNKAQSFVAKVKKGERQLDVFEFIDFCEAVSLDPVKTLRLLVDHKPPQLPR
ncbi:MAG: XRE family transcriptional regulator [Variovorax sp.]|nr:MAG: XRE family transcriptional regulator [Variovorax sp.]